MRGNEDADEVFGLVGPEDSSASPAGGDGESSAIVVRVQVSPGAGRTMVVGRHGDALKLRVGAPPEGGRANEAVAVLLATTLGVSRDQVSLVSGATSRAKRFRVEAVDVGDVRRLLSEAMAGDPTGNARGRRGVR